ncbi:ExbD/TolR family protein [Pseudaestuariivita rosea]|uniref:ExbD/TolR family protein n=1 Tax=Pseudaestuariivita rosea TaxID=2763263 RepID=UPI001ABBBEFD|nr:biopolymer transporter ExbD [Pseudaestuariivita rosea]
MRFDTTPERRKSENIIPMINVVFLLLIFFLMTAQIAPAPPVQIVPPTSADGRSPDEADTLFISAEGKLHFDGKTGDAVLTALADRAPNSVLLIKADAQLDATVIAALLARLQTMGLTSVQLVVKSQ